VKAVHIDEIFISDSLKGKFPGDLKGEVLLHVLQDNPSVTCNWNACGRALGGVSDSVLASPKGDAMRRPECGNLLFRHRDAIGSSFAKGYS
jgi:hypothetical protein